MTAERDYYLSQDGLRLYYRQWYDDTPKGIYCIVHGLGEHSKRYRHVADYLVKSGFAVFAMDLRGHGHSQGKKGHSRRYDLLLSDVEELLKTARAIYTELPMYLMGHSMGGNIVANYMIRMNTNELEGFILSSPWLRLRVVPPKWKLKLGKVMADILPSFTKPTGLNLAHTSTDEKEVSAYISDLLVHDKISAGLFDQIQSAGLYALENVQRITDKGLIYYGDRDRIIDWSATEQFADKCQNCEWKKLPRVPGVYHEFHNDLESEEVLKTITDWLEKSKTTHKCR